MQEAKEKLVTPYRVMQNLAGGAASLVSWKLFGQQAWVVGLQAAELGCPILGDERNGGGLDDMEAALKVSMDALERVEGRRRREYLMGRLRRAVQVVVAGTKARRMALVPAAVVWVDPRRQVYCSAKMPQPEWFRSVVTSLAAS